jgi:hypothetical protein
MISKTCVTRAAHARGVVFLCLAFTSATACAQAWLPDKGTLVVSFDYSDILNKKHFFADGSEVDVGHTSTQAMSINTVYGLSDRFMLKSGLPYITTRYRGDFPHPGHTDEHTNSTFTDLQVSLHYQLKDGPFAVAPYSALVIPTTSYPTLGHSAPGRGLDELWLGFYAAQSLNEWIPRTYVQGRYNYAIVEKVADITHNRTNVDLEIGYFLNPDWSVRLIAAWQETHGGIDLPIPVTDPLFPFHDQLAAEGFLNMGGGVSWTINDRWSAYGLYLHALEGENAHKVDHRVSIGFAMMLGGPR